MRKLSLALVLCIVGVAYGWAQTQTLATLDCAINATEQGGKMRFTSPAQTYTGTCNKLRFTLTESGAYYKGGANRMSFDSFVLYDANGNKVALTAEQFSGNNGKSSFGNMLDGENGTYCNAIWEAGTENDIFEIYLAKDLGGSFFFSFVTENTTMNAKAFKIEVLNEYTMRVSVPQGYEDLVQYNGTQVNDGDAIATDDFDSALLTAGEILGYTMTKTVNETLPLASIAYTAAADLKTTINDQQTYTSPTLHHREKFNKLRFTLTESGAKYKNEALRMSLRAFNLYKADGTAVTLSADMFSGNNTEKNYGNLLDNQHDTYCAGNYYYSDAQDDYFEITLAEDLGGAFSFSFVCESTTMNAKAFKIEALYDYILAVSAPEGNNVAVQYNGNAVEEGAHLDVEGFDPALLTATDIAGYTWSVVVDEAAATVTVVYTEAPDTENPASVVALVNRIGGAGSANKFHFVLSPSMSSNKEIFVLGSKDGKVLIKGNTISAITTGLGWYLNNHANINIAWNSLNEKKEGEAYANLSSLPLPTAEETHTTSAKYRYYLNYCTYGYSMTSWTWKRWQQEIDWMALHGINMPLQIIGLEEVWRKFLTLKAGETRKYGYTDAEAKAFVAGPAFTAWWGMNNLEGWGGTASDGWGGVQDDAWYVRQTTLAQNILARQRELGMQPVLPGFSGMVPSNFTDKTGVATDDNGGNWGGFTRPHIIDPTVEQFAGIAADYYACLEEVMGESQYYSMDPFHEGGRISSGKYTEAYRAVYDAMEKAKSGSQWVIQQWQWDDNQKLCLNAVPAGRLLVLDLFSDGRPEFDKYHGYAPQEAIFCAIPNFGGRSGLMGRLNNLTDNYFSYKAQYASIKGVGAAPEAIEQTPVTYDLLFQLPWMDAKPDLGEWIKKYATARYGTDNAVAQEAWELLRGSVLNYGADDIQGPIEDVWAARPNLDASPASTWGVTINKAGGTYTRERRQMLIDATYKLLGQSEALGLETGSVHESNYLYDLVEFGGGVMADYAYDLLLGIRDAKNAAGENFATNATYIARRDAFLDLIADMDTFKGTNLNFRLGKWTQEARDAAAEVTDATTATADWYEFNNARTLITTWGDQSQNSGLKDYSYRSWQGLLKDYYLPRWQYFFENNCQGTDYFFFEWNWAHGMEHEVGQTTKSTTRLTEGQTGYSYSRTPEGNTVAEATALLAKYIIPVTIGDEVYYAYNFLDNDLTSKITIIANAGDVIDLTPYLGTDVTGTITGDFIEGEASDLSNVVVKSDVADGSHIGTITLANGTTLKFAVAINPPYYGAYHITYKATGGDAPLFIQYNENADLSSNKGNKLIAKGEYQADAAADMIFTLTPCGEGFSISAQGQYLMSPTLSGWNHIMFSERQTEAGAYIVEETRDEGVYRLRSTSDGINYVNDYDYSIFGNDGSDKEDLSTFTFTEVTTYAFNVSDAGMATLCLPFNVELDEGMVAYDFAATNISTESTEGTYVCTMQPIAKAGDVLKGGTPVIIKAAEGIYNLRIVMNDMGAKSALEGSLLRGNFLKQTLTQTTGEPTKFIFTAPEGVAGFYRMQASGIIGANKCWMEWDVPAAMSEVRSIVLDFSAETGIKDVNGEWTGENGRYIYNLSGQRIRTLQQGVNIVGGKKVVVE